VDDGRRAARAVLSWGQPTEVSEGLVPGPDGPGARKAAAAKREVTRTQKLPLLPLLQWLQLLLQGRSQRLGRGSTELALQQPSDSESTARGADSLAGALAH
jgi:hypothetical protein